MEKEILQQYIDACALVEETEMAIKKLEGLQRKIVSDSVKGSMQEFPYAAKTYHIDGLPYAAAKDPGKLDRERELLEERKENAEAVKIQVEAWLNTIPPRMQRMIRYAVFDGDAWEEVARKMGRGATAESVRKEYGRFIAEK